MANKCLRWNLNHLALDTKFLNTEFYSNKLIQTLLSSIVRKHPLSMKVAAGTLFQTLILT